MTQTTSSGVSNLSRAECEERATMTIAAVLAFREGLGTSVIPPTVIHAAELIHGHTTKQVETQGWNRVDWRSHRGGGGGGGRGGSGPARGGGGWKAPASSNGSAPASGPPAAMAAARYEFILLIIQFKLRRAGGPHWHPHLNLFPSMWVVSFCMCWCSYKVLGCCFLRL